MYVKPNFNISCIEAAFAQSITCHKVMIGKRSCSIDVLVPVRVAYGFSLSCRTKVSCTPKYIGDVPTIKRFVEWASTHPALVPDVHSREQPIPCFSLPDLPVAYTVTPRDYTMWPLCDYLLSRHNGARGIPLCRFTSCSRCQSHSIVNHQLDVFPPRLSPPSSFSHFFLFTCRNCGLFALTLFRPDFLHKFINPLHPCIPLY